MRTSASHARISIAAILITLLFCVWPSAHQPSAQAAGGAVYLPLLTMSSAPEISPIVRRVVDLTNQERALQGCPALTISRELSEAAQEHSADMALHDIFSHTGSDNSTPASRAVKVDYSYSWLAENIAAGYATADAVFAAWMSSPGHRENIRNCNLRQIGVGYYDEPGDQANVHTDDGSVGGPFRYYWTQDFGTPQ